MSAHDFSPAMQETFDAACEIARASLDESLNVAGRRYWCDVCGAPAEHAHVNIRELREGRPVTEYTFTSWRCEEHK